MKFKNLQKIIKGLGIYNVKQGHTISERKKKHSMVLLHMRTVAYNIYVFCLGGSASPSPELLEAVPQDPSPSELPQSRPHS